MCGFDALLHFPPPTMSCCLSSLTSRLSAVNVVLSKSCSCPCSPADAPAELSADSWENSVWFRLGKCCISTREIKDFSRFFFSLLVEGNSWAPKFTGFIGNLFLLNVFIPPYCWLYSWQVLRGDLQKQQIFAGVAEISEDYLDVTLYHHLS